MTGGAFWLERRPGERVVALTGSPNVGKSTLFNALTGLRQHTGNWPGKTVTGATGRHVRHGQDYLLADLPGTYSLLAKSPEEAAARDLLCFGGADAAVVISPYYFQLPASSQIEFYEEIARNISGPMILYNFPARTGYSLSADTVLKLAVKHDNIVGIKDTTDEMSHTRSLIQTVKNVRPEFAVYSGFDEYFMHNLLCGGDGCIAGISNFAPRLLSELVRAARSDDLESAARYQKKVDALMEIYSIGSQFVPIIKEAVSQCGVPISAKCTAPLPQVSSKQREEIRSLLKKAGLLS